jgi:hypothetical protein
MVDLDQPEHHHTPTPQARKLIARRRLVRKGLRKLHKAYDRWLIVRYISVVL